MGVEHTMVESSNLGVFGIGDEHCKKEKKNFLNKKIYVKVVQVVDFLYMNHRAEYCLEGVFVLGGGGGGGGEGGGGAYGILCEISFFYFVLQLLQAAGAIQKYMYYSFVISLSAINDTFLSTNYIIIHIYINSFHFFG